MNNNVLRFLEITWLVIALFAFAAGIFNFLKVGFSESVMFFGIAAISVFMFFYRRRLRKSREQ